jgi:hypothetical protein
MSSLRFLAPLALLVATACGQSSGSVLERIPDAPPSDGVKPPSSDVQVLKLDYFIVNDLQSCAAGDPCRNDPDMRSSDCIEFERDDGSRIGFRGDTVEFLPPDQVLAGYYAQVQCFSLTLDQRSIDEVDANFDALRSRIYSLSGTEILLDVRKHELGTVGARLVRYSNEAGGFFVPADTLDAAVPLASDDTAFTFAITGDRDPDQGLTPVLDYCGGSVRELEQGLAGAGYTWLTSGCTDIDGLVRHWLFQVLVERREVNGFDNRYSRDNYPACGAANADPTEWFPSPDDCSSDPDAPTCGNRCDESDDAYLSHLLHAHWPNDFVGNHCQNGREDTTFGEVGVDTGGVCDDVMRSP